MVAPGAVTSSVEPAGRSATIRASSASTEARAEDRSAYPMFPRSTTVSGQRASTPAVRSGGRGQVRGDVPGRVGQRQRGARADGGGAARDLLGQQAPVGAVVELVVVGLQRAHGRHHGARSGGVHRGERPAGGVGVVGLRPGAGVQREPGVGRAGQRQHGVVHQRPHRALAGQPPQRGRGGRRHVAPPQAGDPDDDDMPRRRGRRGLRARRARGDPATRPRPAPRAGRRSSAARTAPGLIVTAPRYPG